MSNYLDYNEAIYHARGVMSEYSPVKIRVFPARNMFATEVIGVYSVGVCYVEISLMAALGNPGYYVYGISVIDSWLHDGGATYDKSCVDELVTAVNGWALKPHLKRIKDWRCRTVREVRKFKVVKMKTRKERMTKI